MNKFKAGDEVMIKGKILAVTDQKPFGSNKPLYNVLINKLRIFINEEDLTLIEPEIKVGAMCIFYNLGSNMEIESRSLGFYGSKDGGRFYDQGYALWDGCMLVEGLSQEEIREKYNNLDPNLGLDMRTL